MDISKPDIIKLIDKKIKEFEDIARRATHTNLYDENYHKTYEGVEMLLTDLYSEEEAQKFRMAVNMGFWVSADANGSVKEYREHIAKCIGSLKAYRERIKNFGVSKAKENLKKSKVPFVSISLREEDKNANVYFTSILDSLQVKYMTGEPYSEKNIPEKVESLIRECDVLISIFVGRGKLKKDQYTPPSWLIREVVYAKSIGKGIILLVEEGVKDIASLNYEKEIIYFQRDDPKKMKNAADRFLQALKVHKVI